MGFLSFVVSAFAISEYVSTPHGMRLKQCVMNFPKDTVLEEVADGLKVEYANGTTVVLDTPDECHADMARLMKEKKARRERSPTNGTNGPVPNQWLDNAGWYPPAGSMSEFTATYTVPGDPSTTSGSDTLYYFIGMQNNGQGPVNILQPVLEFGYGRRWSYTSWICCPRNISTTGNRVFVSAGESLGASIVRLDSSSWDVSGQAMAGRTNLRQVVGSYKYDWADVTMEQYSYSNCAESPGGPITFKNMVIKDYRGQQITPDWSSHTGRTQCNGRLTVVSSSEITIEHSNYLV